MLIPFSFSFQKISLAKIILLLFIGVFLPFSAIGQDDTIPQWRKILLQQTFRDTISNDSISNTFKKIKKEPKDSLSAIPTPTISIKSEKDTSPLLPSSENPKLVGDSIQAKPVTRGPVTFEERLSHVMGLPTAAIDSIEENGISDKNREEKDRATKILSAESPTKIFYIWGYVIDKNDFDFLLPRLLVYYQTIRKNNELPAEDKRTSMIKMMHLLDSVGNRAILKKQLLDATKRLGEISRNKNIVLKPQTDSTSVAVASKPTKDTLLLPSPIIHKSSSDSIAKLPAHLAENIAIPLPKTEPAKTITITFDHRLLLVLTLSAQAIDSIEASGLSEKIQDDKNKATRILEAENPAKILYIWGYAIAKSDFDFLLPRSLGFYQTIRKNNGLPDEDKRTCIIKVMYLLDSLDNRIITKKHLLDVSKRLGEISRNKNFQPNIDAVPANAGVAPKPIILAKDSVPSIENKSVPVIPVPTPTGNIATIVNQPKTDSLTVQSPINHLAKKDSVPDPTAVINANVAVPAPKPETVKAPPMNFDQRLSKILAMPAATVDSIENSGISDKTQDDKNKASRILEEEKPAKILYLWGYAIAQSDFDFLFPRSLGFYQSIRKNSALPDEDKRASIIKVMYLIDSVGTRVITKKQLLDNTRRLAEISIHSTIQIKLSADTTQLVILPKTIKIHNDTSSTFEDRFFRILHYPATRIDSIEASGLSVTSADDKNRASIILEEDSPNDINIAWGFATSNRDFNFFLAKDINDYRTIRTKAGLKDEEDKRISIIKILYLADTLQDRIVTHREFVEATKKIASLASQKVSSTDVLQYNRIAVPTDEFAREVLKDNLSKIELLPGGFKTSITLKLQIQKRILEIYGANALEKLSQEEYNNIIKKISFKCDTNKDRILTGTEVRIGLINMRSLLQEADDSTPQ